MNYGVASFLSLSRSICNSKHALQELEGPQRLLLPPFEGELLERARTSRLTSISPQGQAPR